MTGSTAGRKSIYHRGMPAEAAAAAVDEVYRSDWGRIVATLIRMLGDFDVAEEAVQEAFAAAVEQWRTSGVPEYPRRRNPVRRPRHDRHARAARRGADGHLSDLHRRLRADARRGSGQDRSVRRGDSPRTSGTDAHGAASAGGSDGARRADAAPRR